MSFYKFNIIIPPQELQENPECLKKLACGDRNAFEWLYKNYCTKLYKYIFLLTTDEQLSEDIVQDVFIKIWANKEKLQNVSNFNSYLYTAAKNLLHDKWRRKSLEKKHLNMYACPMPVIEQNGFFGRNEEQQINKAIQSLSPRQRLIFSLIREEGRTREQISKALDISPNTVKATMQNALKNLKKQVQSEMGIIEDT